MSEVQRFWSHEASNIRCVRSSDFDRVAAERNAERRRADVAVGDANDAEAAGKKVSELLAKRTAERDALQQRLTAADERADVLEKALRTSRDVLWAIKDGLGLMDGFAASTAMGMADAALKSAEGVKPKMCDCNQGRLACNGQCKAVEGGGDEPNCLMCLDKKTVPSNLAEGYAMDCPDCCGEEG